PAIDEARTFWRVHARAGALDARLDDAQTVVRHNPVLLPARLLDRMGPGERERRDGKHGELAGREDAQRHHPSPCGDGFADEFRPSRCSDRSSAAVRADRRARHKWMATTRIASTIPSWSVNGMASTRLNAAAVASARS